MMDYAEMNREDAKAQLLYARDEGIAQGLRQGRNEESAHIARAALSEGLPVDFVARITGLDVETIRRLQEN